MAKISIFFLASVLVGCLAANYAPTLVNHKTIQSYFEHVHINQTTLTDLRYKIRQSTLVALRDLPNDEKKKLIEEAEHEYKTGHYEQLTAWDWLEYDRTGSPQNYEAKLNQRNRRLSLLTIGHLIDEAHNLNSSLYLDEIVNGVWIMCQDTNWAFPWTMVHLPEPNEIWVDIGAAETSAQIAWVKLLMKEKFDKIPDAKINSRIDLELEKRIFAPYVKFSYRWDGLVNGQQTVNNWNSWINSNILKSAVYTMNNEAQFNKLLQKSVQSVDVFLNNYGEDGGCEEGPQFWIQAGGHLIEYILTLAQIESKSQDYFAKNKLIKAIGDYSWKMRITNHTFVSFSDSVPSIVYPPSMVYLYGTLFQDNVMKEYASFLFHENGQKHHIQNLDSFVHFIQVRKALTQFDPIAPTPKIVSLPNLQITTAHSIPRGNSSKLFLAGRMGTNYEFHSHNDVGNYILYQNGNPVLIDVGAGTFTSKTNGPKRYSELFYTQSQYHNCPTINGMNQQAGYPFKASDVSIVVAGDESFVTLRGNLRDAYPKNAGINSWNRIIYIDRNIDEVKVQDFYKLNQYIAPHKFNFMTVSDMILTRTASGLLLHNEKVAVNMEFGWNTYTLETEEISLTNDKALSEVWGNSVLRFSLVTKPEVNQLVNYLTFIFRSDDKNVQ